MPFGKYKGRRLIDLPEEYLLWFARKDEFPAGRLGELMAITLLIKTGADPAGSAPETSLNFRGVGLFLRQLFRLRLVTPRQYRTHHQLDLMENHQRQHHHPNDGRREKNIGHWDPGGLFSIRKIQW